jgi:DNA-binding NtrC family response regulator
MARVGWKAWSGGLARLVPHHTAPRIVAIIPHGPIRFLLQSISQDAGWALTLSETPLISNSARQDDVPPIVIYDRDLSPGRWHEIVGDLAKSSPRPYVILLSRNADANLWDELQRVGGSDILRVPVTRDNMLGALKKAGQLWHSQNQVRLPSTKRL